MERYFLCGATYQVVRPTDPDFYVKVNPDMIEVRKVRGGWKPIDKARWLGLVPIKASNKPN